MSDKIKIDTVHGGDDKGILMDCYFKPAGNGKYNFYHKDQDPKDPPLVPDVSQTNSFSFKLGELYWTVDGRSFLISDTAAHGDWTSHNHPGDGDDGDGESGTFTAQAGGTGRPEETASSAKA